MISIEDVKTLEDGTRRFSVRLDGILVRGWRLSKDGNLYAPGTKTRTGWYNIVDLANVPSDVRAKLDEAISNHPELTSSTSAKPSHKCLSCANPGSGIRHAPDCPKLATN